MDCLAFKQIDQDVDQFKFTNSYCEETPELLATRTSELQDIRVLLRCLVLWNRQSAKEGQQTIFTYGQGTMEILQRLLALTKSAEETFWIMVGIITAFPRMFTVTNSVMADDTNSLMRYEMIAFRT